MAESKRKEPSLWQQVADAGFGAAVEACGFERMGVAYWRLKSVDQIFLVRLRRGPQKKPRSIRDEIGVQIEGMSELADQLGLEGWREFGEYRFPGTKIMVHAGAGLEDLFRQHEWNRYQDRKARFENLSFWGQLKNFRKVPGDFLKDEYKPPPAFGEVGNRDKFPYWDLENHTPQEVSDTLTRLWNDHGWPWIKKNLTYQQYYRNTWRDSILKHGSFNPYLFLDAALAQDVETLQGLADKIAHQLERSVEDRYQGYLVPIWRPFSMQAPKKPVRTDIDAADLRLIGLRELNYWYDNIDQFEDHLSKTSMKITLPKVNEKLRAAWRQYCDTRRNPYLGPRSDWPGYND